MNLVRWSSILLVGGSLTGCVPFPIYTTVQPAAQITVLDENNRPIEEAKVNLIASAHPHPVELGRDIKMTDAGGLAMFDSRHEWRQGSFMMHGMEFFFWNWCVQKPGFKTYRSNMGSAGQFEPQPTIRLSRGASSDCLEKS